MLDGANGAFVDAMTTGFWISVGFIVIGLATSLFLLPKQSRVTQEGSRRRQVRRSCRQDRERHAGSVRPVEQLGGTLRGSAEQSRRAILAIRNAPPDLLAPVAEVPRRASDAPFG